MGIEILTVADLEDFRLKMLRDIEKLIGTNKPKKWLKTHEVMELLDMSEVTLQTLRNKGIIPYRKLGGVCYYNIEEIENALNQL
ncbi:helix-turn-helix domain-containing protein [Mucilaginibacter sp. dw_454]|uniref:helix-turn-helix domain-containing protein n=1 Tax=Mucilaginibacter sp. dw_454 TaxID=2720079 RepID=UPI001BD1E6D7|nr:helix-turn-helix domain-containing protein [Mucilaginibacter sp. dw_454]